MDCGEVVPLELSAGSDEIKFDTFAALAAQLDAIFALGLKFDDIKDKITQLLLRVNVLTTETNKYTFFDCEKPYTRNLICSDGKHYSLLLLCWGPGKETKIHNHPCDGCFIKNISGCIKETRYSFDKAADEIKQCCSKYYCEGQVSFMSDDIGLHKISNPNPNVGAVTLHLYTPPFKECKVWSNEGKGQFSKPEKGVIGYYSVCGLRTPHLEGKPGLFARMQQELLEKHGEKVESAAAL